MIYEFFPELFPYEKFAVEYEAYKALKEIKDINYIAIPWTQILNSAWIKYPNCQNAKYYFNILSKEKINQQNNFTICQHDAYISLKWLFKELNITKIFCPLHDVNNNLEDISIIPISFTTFFNFEEVYKDILFSFVGSYMTHPLRQRMKDRINGQHIIYRNGFHIDSNTYNNEINLKEKEESEYKNIIERSRFSICPRGSSSSSIRFWESLQAGAIPILISDHWKLPDWDWDNTIIHIKEKDFENLTYQDIEKLLQHISTVQENNMRYNCKKAFNKFKKENYKNYILSNI